jgi:MYXO-CTERM domain-containing protein
MRRLAWIIAIIALLAGLPDASAADGGAKADTTSTPDSSFMQPPVDDSEGCSCRAVESPAAPLGLGLLLGLLVLRRRRRRRS